MKNSGPKIVVVGAGIVGASVAYHLAQRGAMVTLVDKGRPAGEATGKSFAWINVSHDIPEPYYRLRHLAIEEYRRLVGELDDALQVDWCGSLVWRREQAETERFVREHSEWGYDIRLIERSETAELEPNLIELPDCAAYAPSEGAIDPTAATEALVHGAKGLGADTRMANDVIALVANGHKITGVRTSEGNINADVVVLAAGTGASALCEPVGVHLPVSSSPALLLRFRAADHLVNTVISNPELEIRQSSDRHLLAAENVSDGSTLADIDAIAHRTLATIKDHLRGADAVEVESASVGMRPIPDDGLPVVGFCSQVEGLYSSVMHAGVTLAPAIGRFAASEILDGVDVQALEACRLERFLAGSPISEA